MDHRNQRKSPSTMNRILKRIRALFCTYDNAQTRDNDESSALAPIDPSVLSTTSPSSSISKEIPIEISNVKTKTNESTSVVYREHFVRPSLLLPRRYFHDLLNCSTPHYSTLMRRDVEVQRRFHPSSCSFPHHRSLALEHRKTIYPPIPFAEEDLAYEEFRRLSMLTWSRSVRRLNKEYRLTVNALEQIKEQIERNEGTTNTQTKEMIDQSTDPLVPPPTKPIEETNTTAIVRPILSRSPVENVSFPPMPIDLSKTKIVQAMDLNSYSVLSFSENEKEDRTNLSSSLELPLVASTSDVQTDETLNSIDLKSSTVTELMSIEPSTENSQIEDEEQSEEETTYTVEIIYRKIDPNSTEIFNPKRDILIIRKETTEESFNPLQQNETLEGISLDSSTTSQTILSSTEKAEDSSVDSLSTSSLVARNAKILETTRASLSESSDRTESPPLIDKNHVRSIIKQMNSLSTTSPSTISRAKTFQSNKFSSTGSQLTHTKHLSSNYRLNKTEEDQLLHWCQNQLINYPISIRDFSPSSWSNGLALAALIDHLYPNQFDWSQLSADRPNDNFQLPLRIAEQCGKIPPNVNPLDLSRTLIPYLYSLFSSQKDF